MVGQQPCHSGCGSTTKYCCISCNVYVCNCPFCSVAEEDENVDGWMQNSSVSYCNDCIFGARESSQFPDSPCVFENDDEMTMMMKNSGRKSLWDADYIDDMVDIITNNENFKRKLIFTNNKKATNGEVYKLVLKELIKRHSSFPFPFPIQQMRNKFKWCVKHVQESGFNCTNSYRH